MYIMYKNQEVGELFNLQNLNKFPKNYGFH